MAEKKKRKRDVKMTIWFEKDELSLIRNQMGKIGETNFSDYVRTMAMVGEVIQFDFSELAKLRKTARIDIRVIAKGVKRA